MVVGLLGLNGVDALVAAVELRSAPEVALIQHHVVEEITVLEVIQCPKHA